MTAEELERLARALSKAQRKAVRTASCGGFGRSSSHLYHRGQEATRRALAEAGIATMWRRLTPDGEALAAYLRSKEQEPQHDR